MTVFASGVLVTMFLGTVVHAADTPPVASMFPTNVVAAPIPGGALVSWDPVTTVGRIDLGSGFGGAAVADRYFVTSSYDPATNSGYRTCVVRAPETSCVITGLVNGVSYTFQVKTDARMIAHDSPNFTGEAREWSDYSPPTAAVTPCCSAATPVASVDIVVSGDAVSLSWSPPANWGGASALTYRVTSSDGTPLCETAAAVCRVEGLPFQTPLLFDVIAVNAGGASPPVRSTAVTIPVQAPRAPVAGSVRYTRGGQATVTWKPPSRDGGAPISGYLVSSSPGGRSCSTTGAIMCTVDGLQSGRAYTFVVRARNKAGLSPASAPMVAGRLVTPASRPRNVSVEPRTTSVDLRWSRPASTGGGTLLRYVVEDGDRLVCQTRRTTCTVTDLAPGTSHRFRIYAVNTSGKGQSVSIAATTTVPVVRPPAPPALPGPAPAAPDKPEQNPS